MRRILVFVPVLGLFLATAVIILAVRAPRTWADHWTSPSVVAHGSGDDEYGAVALPSRRWDILWLDFDTSRIVYTHEAVGGHTTSYNVDGGDVQQPDIIPVGQSEFGVWVHNFNGSTDLEAATFTGGRPQRIFHILKSRVPLEHPHVVRGPHGTAEILFAWQRPNMDLFLARVSISSGRIQALKRLTRAQVYSFYPKVAIDGQGHIVTLHLESCCQQKQWNILLTRFDVSGRRLGKPVSIRHILNQGDTPQWGEDLQTDPAGNVWGAVTADVGVLLFAISPSGQMLVPPHQIDSLGGAPNSLALALGRGRYVFWQQPSLFGGWLAAATFNRAGRLSGPERAVYEGGAQENPHAVASAGGADVLWQDVSKYGAATFQMSRYEPTSHPTLAQRLGVGVGNTWLDVGVLIGGTISIALLTLAANVLDVLVIIAAGLLFMWLVHRLRQRWILYAAFLAGLLFALFVDPGGPLLFLQTLPVSGLPAMPYGVLATIAAFGFILWLSSFVLNHVDDVYRIGVMACAGVFFFGFIEAVTFIEGQLSYLG